MLTTQEIQLGLGVKETRLRRQLARQELESAALLASPPTAPARQRVAMLQVTQESRERWAAERQARAKPAPVKQIAAMAPPIRPVTPTRRKTLARANVDIASIE